MDFDFRPSKNIDTNTEIDTDIDFDFRPSQFDFSQDTTVVAPPVINPLETQSIDQNPMSNVFNKTMDRMEQKDSVGIFDGSSSPDLSGAAIPQNPISNDLNKTMNRMEKNDSRSMFTPKPVFDPAGFPIDLDRPIVMDDQGNAQTERGVTIDASELGYPFNPGQKFVNIPSVINGVAMSGDAALALTKKKIENGSIDASKFPMFNSIEEATAGSIDRSKKIGEERKDEFKKATKQFKIDQEVKRLTDLYGKPTKGQEKLDRNPNQSLIGGSYNNFTLKTELGDVKIDNESAIKMIADSNISEGEFSRLPNYAFPRGMVNAQISSLMITSRFGFKDPAETFKQIAELTRTKPNEPKEVTEVKKKIFDADNTWGESFKAIADNPDIILTVVGESIPQSLPSLAAFLGVSAVTKNPWAGAGASTLVTYGYVYSTMMLEEIQKSGVDIDDTQAVTALLSDEKFMERARLSSNAYGIPVAMFDGLSMGIAGKLVNMVLRSGASTPKVLGASVVELNNQGMLGAAGDYTGQYLQMILGLKDKIGKGEVLAEYFAEIPTGGVEVATNVYGSAKTNLEERKLNSAFDNTSKEIAQDTAIDKFNPDNAQLTVIPEKIEDFDFRPSKKESLAVENESSLVEQPENQTKETPVVEKPVVEAPVVEAPVVEKPVVEKPVVEAPPEPKPRPEAVKIDPAPKAVETETEVEPLQTKDSSKQVKPIGKFMGKFEKIRTPGSEKEVSVGYMVVDANKLKQASGDFQPRDRDLKESEIQINKRAAKLDPKQLLEAPTTNTGAPIISTDGTIISGNGRVLMLKKALASYPAEWKKYAQAVDEYTNESFSNNMNEIPIVVRVLDGEFTNQQLIELANLSNKDSIASMNATERAVRDAKDMGIDLVSQYQGGDLTKSENRQFVNQFIQKVVSLNEQNTMTKDGAITREGVLRIQNAILASAYEDTNTLGTMLDSTDDNIKAISNAMLSAAPKFAQLKSNIAGGQVEAKYDITPQITDMAQRVSTARKNGTAISDILNQGDMLAEIDPLVNMLIKGIYNDKLTRAKSQKFMTEFLNAYVEEASKKQTGGMFEDNTTVGEVIELARSKADGQEDPTLFERGTRSSSQGVIESRQQKQRADLERSSTRPEKRTNQKQEVLEDAAVEQDGEVADIRSITEAIIVENEESYKNQRVEKPGTLVNKLAERNKTALIFSAFEAAGLDPNIAVNLPIERQYQILQKMFVDQFGMKQVTKSKDKNSKDAVDQLLTGYHNLSALANFFNLPYKAIGLEGTLTFDMVQNYGAYGSYNRGTKAITIPRRVNSFAHEWFHALDHYMNEKFGVLSVDDIFTGGKLMSQAIRKDGKNAVLPDAPKNLKEAYANLVRAMFQDKAVESQKLIEIDNEIARISKKRPDAKKIQVLLKRKESILGGKASSRTVDKSQFRKDAEFFAPIIKSDVNYWASPHEMFARVGEAFTTYKMNLATMDSDFLSKTNEGYLITLEQLGVTKEGLQNSANVNKILDSRMALTFPKEQERLEIFGAMQNLIDAIGQDTVLGDGITGKTLPEDTRVDVRKLYELPKERSESLMQEQRRVMNEAKLFKERLKERQKLLDQGLRERNLGTRFYEALEDVVFSQAFYQKQGVLKSIMKRYPRNREMQYLFQNLGTQAGGKLQSTATGGNFADATVRQARLYSLQLTAIIEQNKINEMSTDDRKLLRMILTSQDTFDSAPKNVIKAAGQLRGLMNGIYEYMRIAGLDLGYAESGYMQRVPDLEMVNARPYKFKKQAAKVYEIIFKNENGELNPTDIKQMISVVEFIQDSKLGIVESQEYIDFTRSKEFKDLKINYETSKRLNKKKETTGLDEKEQAELEKVESELEQQISEISEMYQKFYSDMKFAYGDTSAIKWKNTIYEKQVGEALDAPPASNLTKKRKLPPEADALLDEFYVSDPIENIISYIMSASRKAEYNRRFGEQKIPEVDSEGKVPKGVYNDYIEYLTQRGFNNAGIAESDAKMFNSTVNLITGKATANQDHVAASALNHIHALTSITLLVRAPIASIAEPFTAAITSESVAKGFSSFVTTLQEFPGIRKLGGNPEDIRLRQQFSRILGVIDDPEVGDILTNRIGGSVGNNPKLNRMMQQFFYKTKLTGLTNAQRRTAAKMGFQFISEMAHEYKNPNNERAKLKAKKVLNDFGVADSNMDQFSDYITSFNDFKVTKIRKKSRIKGKTKLPANEDIMYDSGEYSDMGMQLSVAIMRFADQTIQDPRIADRPKWAETPLGRIVYGITSFIYSFQDKVLKGMARKVGREYGISKELGASKKKAALDATAYVAATVAPTMITLYSGHLIFSTLRELMLNQDRWDREWEENEKDPVKFATDYLLPLAFARSGFTGAFDPIYQMFTGLKYRRDFSNIFIGTGGYGAQNFQNIAQYFINNSENTLSNEYNALKGLWNLTINPILSYLYSIAPMSPPTALGGMPILMKLTSEDFKNARVNDILELIYGERYTPGKRGRKKKQFKIGK